MTLTAPTHLRGKMPNLPGKPSALIEERSAWIAAQIKAGHNREAISRALGVSEQTALRFIREARLKGMIPPSAATAEAPAPVIAADDPTKRVVICGSARVTLPRLPGDDAEGEACIHRPETDPRFSLVRLHPSPSRRINIAAVIAAIRQEKEAME